MCSANDWPAEEGSFSSPTERGQSAGLLISQPFWARVNGGVSKAASKRTARGVHL
jgi:hypothetical protein